VEKFVKIASRSVTSLLQRMTSSKMHSRAAFAIVLCFAVVVFSAACAQRQHVRTGAQANDQQSDSRNQIASSSQAAKRVNINTASARELEQLPGIGKALAERIIEHREKYGPFRRAEHLIIVRGISDRKFRALRDLITVE
jgi:competence ComEA-like helix-hairpin-helix protein